VSHPKIRTSHVFPPIPQRQFDYAAVFDGYEPGDSIGYGRDEQEAIDDLLEQWNDDNELRRSVEEAGGIEGTQQAERKF
jgi:hypothetical protein